MLTIGTKAPAWSSSDQNGKKCGSADYAGKWLILYFYPKDDTPGCTIEACGFRDRHDVLLKRAAVVGVSADSEASHKAFIAKFTLPFTLIADTDKTMIKAYEVGGILFPKRVTFLINPSGDIAKIYHGFDCNDHVTDIQKDLDTLSA